jgi:hypothetical protein
MAEASSENKTATKLQIDRPEDFKFHIAYDVYSRAWDNNSAEAARLRLNELITALADGKGDYSSFYSQIQEYRKDVDSFRSGRTRIRTERKRNWQTAETRNGRNRRHK